MEAEPTSGAAPAPAPQWRTIPNLLSFGRLVLTPLVAWLILRDQTVAAVVLLALMGITDFLDGYIARRTDTVTDLGTVLDPVSDRVLVMAVLVVMMIAGDLPVWLGAPVLLRDVALSIVFLGVSRRGFGKPKVRQVGKTATFALLVALPVILLGDPVRIVGLFVFGAGASLYFVAAYRYALDVRAWMASQREPFA